VRADELAVPVDEQPEMAWGSDAIAEVLRRLGLPFFSYVPGASYRGLHDSMVNYLGNASPQMVLCLHEEHAVAVAQGYAKVTGRPMAVGLHSNVGLMHATMAIFNAYCDRAPMVILGATGPLDAAERRPWIDWIHTAADQGALIRNYTKWDDQPGSVEAAVESVIRADQITRSYPSAPTYVCLDAGLQESRLPAPVELPDLALYQPPEPPAPSPEALRRALGLLAGAQRPLILFGRGGRGEDAWTDRVRLAEHLGAYVLTDLKTPAMFPTAHPLHPAAPGTRVTASGTELLRHSDLILSLDWIDLAGTLRAAFADGAVPPVISCTNDGSLHNGWSKDYFALPPADTVVCAHPDAFVRALLAALEAGGDVQPAGWPPAAALAAHPRAGDVAGLDGTDRPDAGLVMADLAAGLRQAVGDRPACWISLSRGWPSGQLDFRGPLDYLGKDGGGGVGAGPGIAVGAALALQGTGRLPLAVIGDGDFLMGNSALWTAAHHRLPLLIVVANNRTYYNDEVHQERVARRRGRPVENRSVGQHIRNPDPDLAVMARSMGLHGYGPVWTPVELKESLARAVADVEAGGAAVVDVRVSPTGGEHDVGARVGRGAEG
jgi:thiamine pyrophosphate-dependent acetolactate synthase large subunit-like protein